MARQFLTGLDLNKNQLLNARIQNLAIAPASPVAGQIYYNTGDNTLRYWNGTAWLTLAQGGSVGEAIQAAIDLLDTDDIEEGSSNLYFTDARAKTSAADLLTGPGTTLTNITITGDGSGLTITAENGVADSTTDDLDEGSTNKYFTDERAQDAVGNAVGTGLTYNDTTGAVSLKFSQSNGAIGIDGSGNVKVNVDNVTINTAGSASFLRVDTGQDSPVASKTYADGVAGTAVTNHNNLTSGVHGVTGNVVGDTDSQTLTNKTLGSGTVLSDDVDANGNTITDLGAPTVDSDAATKGYVDTEIGDHSDLTTGVHGVTGDVVGTSDTQTLTNKTLGSGSSLSADLDADGYKITALGTPTADSDAANKAYVDSTAQGLDVKASVHVATLIAGTLATSFENGDVIDGHTLQTGNRILIKNQADSKENGIYVVNATGAPTRSADADTDVELTKGSFVFVENGSQISTGWVLSTVTGALDAAGSVRTFTQFSGAGLIDAGNGLTKTGNTLDVVGTSDRITVNADSVDIASTYAGQSSITTVGTIATGTWNGTTIAIANGGTGATTAAGARTNLGATTKYTAANTLLTETSGSVTWTVNHNLGIRTVLVQVYDLENFEEVVVDVERTNTNTVTLSWVAADDVAADSYQVVVIG